ncbi:DUF3238 domain-containing protein [Sporosarcina sp. 179-K 3D1 HS]|uniref:DUF3238 domain-containing protein n=1 Tax=Sporosarcina sp. 179-K 3D1 HS TaxID=3232169 RepID=UPI0039A3CFCC
MQPLFEIKTVLHEADLISFTWNDVGGLYRVYKDGTHLYEGTVAEFSDGDFTHAKLYTYTIERLENGEVVDVIVLQTSAFAEEKNKENPLQSIVMTTIVAKTQIALSWEKIKDIEEYHILRNGVYVETVRRNRYIDRDISLDEPSTYSIHAERPLAQSEEQLNVSKSIVSQVFGSLNPFATKEEAEVEQFWITKEIDPPSQLLLPIQEKEPRNKVDRWKFRYTTFLADKWVTNPNVLSPNHYFKGDGRGFNPEGKGFRTRVDVGLAYDLDRSPLTFTKQVGESVAYNYLKRYRERAAASPDGITLKRLDHGEEESGFLLQHAGGNPLTTAPQIDYEVTAVMRRDGLFDIWGYHDQAPHHEVYLARGDGKWEDIHLAESKGLAWMSRIVAWQYWRISNLQ